MTLRLRGYTELSVLARGPEGELVEARYLETGQRVAIRHIPPAVAADPQAADRLRAAVDELGELDEPALARPFALVSQGSQAAVLAELVEGVGLDELVEAAPLPIEDGLVVLRSVLRGIGRMHSLGLVHGRLGGASVVVTPAGRACVVDGYVAAALDAATHPLPRRRPAAPELASSGQATARSDLYAASLLFLDCVGALREGAPEPRGRGRAGSIDARTVPAQVATQLRRALAADPRRRPASAAALERALGTAANAALGPGWADRGREHLAELAGAAGERAAPAERAAGAAGAPARSPWRRRLAITAATVVLLAAAAVGVSALTASQVSAPSATPGARVSASPGSQPSGQGTAVPLVEDLRFSGDLAGTLGTAQTGGSSLPPVCGAQPNGAFRFVITGEVGARTVTVAAYIAPFNGPGTYGSAPGASPPAGPATSPVALVVAAGGQRWVAVEVQVTVAPGGVDGRLDARLAPVPTDPAPLVARTTVQGSWSCRHR